MNEIVDLSRNEFLFEHPLLRSDSLPKLTAQEICQYRLNSKLLPKLAAFHGIEEKCLGVYNGAEHALKSAICGVSKIPDAVLLLPSPGWDYYREIATQYNVKTAPYYYRETKNKEFVLDFDDLTATIGKTKRVVLLMVSPSNPLGCRIDKNEIRQLTELVGEKGYSILDQTYVGFSGSGEKSLPKILNTLPNTLIIRSFSKYYGMAGLRVGYIAAEPETQKAFSMFGDYLGFNAFSDAFASQCLDRHSEFEKIAHKTVQGRERLRDFFNSLEGFSAFQSYANFLLVRVPMTSRYATFLFDNGIKVKSFNDNVIGNCVRITIPPSDVIDHVEKLTERFCAKAIPIARRPLDNPTGQEIPQGRKLERL